MNRIFQIIPVLFGIATLVFFLQRLIPGSPADTVMGPDTPFQQKQEWLMKYGFDKSITEQYFTYMQGLMKGDFGRTFSDYKPVFTVIYPRIIETLKLAICAFFFSLFIAVLTGSISAAKAGKYTDRAISLISIIFISAPSFIIGTVMIWIFSVKLDLLPLTGNSSLLSYILPTLTLGTALAAFTSRMIRSGLVDVLAEDYIRTARSKGLSPFIIIAKHALRNAFLPALTILGMQLGVLLGGTVITEQIFSWPGLGTLTIEAVQAREYNLVSGCVLVIATGYVLANLLVDFLYRLLDPRVRLQ